MYKSIDDALEESELSIKKLVAKKVQEFDESKEAIESLLPERVEINKRIRGMVPKFKFIVDKMDRGRDLHSYHQSGIWCDEGLWGLFVNARGPDSLSVNFHVDIAPHDAGRIAVQVAKIASEMGMNAEVGWCYAFKAENDGTSTVVFSEAAYDLAGRDYNFLYWYTIFGEDDECFDGDDEY